jgi:hypothetical protein
MEAAVGVGVGVEVSPSWVRLETAEAARGVAAAGLAQEECWARAVAKTEVVVAELAAAAVERERLKGEA